LFVVLIEISRIFMFEKGFPEIMGILNVTPDSFSDGGLYYSYENAIAQGLKLIDDGADILDIGGESTRPGAVEITEEEEIRRVLPVIEQIRSSRPGVRISIDTIRYAVAEAAVNAGADIINDVSGLDHDKRLAELAAQKDVSLILMHMLGSPRTMQDNPKYENVIEDIFSELKQKIDTAKNLGVKSIIADVGVGFGKTFEHNLKLLKYHDKFDGLGVKLLLGLSRKSFIHIMLNVENPIDRDVPTAMIHALLLNHNIAIIRVHNVEIVSMLKKIYLAFKKV
jgi:dihydropteroate synthase